MLEVKDDPQMNGRNGRIHLIYGRNINEKCYSYEFDNSTDDDDARSSFKRTAEIMHKFFKKFDNEYITSLQERYFYNKTKFENKCRACTVMLFK